jgi:hypothetical protein
LVGPALEKQSWIKCCIRLIFILSENTVTIHIKLTKYDNNNNNNNNTNSLRRITPIYALFGLPSPAPIFWSYNLITIIVDVV